VLGPQTATVLDQRPTGALLKAKAAWHDISGAATRAEAEQAFDLVVKTSQAQAPKPREGLVKDREVLLTFSDFSAEHWVHLRTTNPLASVCSRVRLRPAKTKGKGSRVACLTRVFKLRESASKGWRSLNGSPLLAEIVRGVVFIDGIKEKPAA
jgi:putative transposase